MKRIFTILLTLIILCLTAISSNAIYQEEGGLRLSDWAIGIHHMAHEYDILSYYQENRDFTLPITRAEFCDMIFNVVKSAHYGIRSEIDVCTPEPFKDTDRYSIYCLEQLGIAKGIGNGYFNPSGTLTREQAAAFIYRAGEIIDFTYLPEEKLIFTDKSNISPWASDAVDIMQESGLMIGTDTGEFLPQNYLTREQAAAMLVRFHEKNGANKFLSIKIDEKLLKLEDLEGLNGKYRSTGKESYEITYTADYYSSLVVKVKNNKITSAVFTFLGSGWSCDLTKHRLEDAPSWAYYSSRDYLGNNAYTKTNDDTAELELNGKTVLTLPLSKCGGSFKYQKMNSTYVAYSSNGKTTTFFSIPDGNELFSVKGYVDSIDNHYIITEEYCYDGGNVDAIYSIYAVYSLDGKLIEDMGLEKYELYSKGYISDY